MMLALACFVSLSSIDSSRSQDTVTLSPYSLVTHAPIVEMSGIVPSKAYPGVFWVMNDSGDEPRIFAIDSAGRTIMPTWLGKQYFVGDSLPGRKAHPGIRIELAANIDWEDVTIHNDQLYIADVGNNGNARRDLGVYVVTEPNPQSIDRARIAQWIPITYPDQDTFPGTRWHFDCEATFVHHGKLYFITKNHKDGRIDLPDVSASLYCLDEMRTDRTNILRKVDEHLDLGGWVTSAHLSPDGTTLAVLCNAPAQSVWLFDVRGNSDRLLSGPARRLIFKNAKQAEAICFISDKTLIVTNEQREMFMLDVDAFVKQ